MKRILILGVVVGIFGMWTAAEADWPCGRTELGALYTQVVQDGNLHARAKLVTETVRLVHCLDRGGRLPESPASLKGDFAGVLLVAAIARGLDPIRLTSADELARFINLSIVKRADRD